MRCSLPPAFLWAPLVLSVAACGSEANNEDTNSAQDAGVFVVDAGNGPDDHVDAGQAAPDGGSTDVGQAATDGGSSDAGERCTYPVAAVEPMTLNEVISPYSWPAAIDGVGGRFDLDLTEVFCTADEDIDWSPFDVLLFISIPGW